MDYGSNSHKSKEVIPEKNVQKVVTGKVVTKKNEIKKFTDIFVSEDVSNVKSYIFLDILVPAIKKAISDIVTNGIDMILYGETGSSKKNSTASKVSYRSYDRMYDVREPSRTTRIGYDYDDIIIPSRGEAEDVLLRMKELIDKYDIASIGDLYDLVGISGNYTDNKYGWTDLSGAKVIPVRDGYLLKLPKALPLN